MILPIDLLEAAAKAVAMFGYECTDTESGIDFAWSLMAFFPASDEDFDRFDQATVAELPNLEIFQGLNPSAEALEIYEDLQLAAASGAPYGQILNDLKARILPTIEASA